MKKLLLLTSFLLVIGLYACSNEGEDSEIADLAESNEEKAASDDAGFSESEDRDMSGNQNEADGEDTAVDNQATNQMIIKTGRISIEVSNFNQATEKIRDELDHMNGYVVQSSSHKRGEEENMYGEIIVRVPQEHFTSFMNNIESENARVLSKSEEGEDVTEEYVDLEARLKAKEAVETRLLSFMEDAEKTEDLLKISDDLSSVQSEIEQIKGRMNYLENHVAYSTVTITIQEKAISVPEVQSQSELNTFAKAQKLFMDSLNFLLNIGSGVVVAIVGLSPVLIPLLIIGLIVFFRIRRTKND
ncbi:DUF4349 domain-containing protein [Tenuibacillus multivorans]|uniref:DUF4349 domain-containing protein n=1 Tax=Tenuibacillus multivorans TaxID=237069 RepID=A0A1H0EU35_9BACI|nr:DUF4349 domain-containing protein [Tenuibacillus multivorans]GEL76955.1 hypothetical protein TMU01_11900 [Tenuibacillus multivorans]SDN85806.1 protein of unknown function [Tenuibacillus multivorans]